VDASTSRSDGAGSRAIGAEELLVRSEASAVRSARSFARRLAGRIPTEADEAVELLVAELVTNAVVHGAPPVTVRIESLPDRVRIAVTDTSPRLPLAGPPQAESITGRGLQIVKALSSGWGVVPRAEGGKVVWADVATACDP
jgi:anti-sigma regulatory factor (Ser/Thr protein kinase)